MKIHLFAEKNMFFVVVFLNNKIYFYHFLLGELTFQAAFSGTTHFNWVWLVLEKKGEGPTNQPTDRPTDIGDYIGFLFCEP